MHCLTRVSRFTAGSCTKRQEGDSKVCRLDHTVESEPRQIPVKDSDEDPTETMPDDALRSRAAVHGHRRRMTKKSRKVEKPKSDQKNEKSKSRKIEKSKSTEKSKSDHQKNKKSKSPEKSQSPEKSKSEN